MNPIFKKLNFKDQSPLLIINAPASFEKEMAEMTDLTGIKTSLSDIASTSFIMAFVTKQAEINKLIPQLDRRLEGDGLLWFCYPKGTSKNYTCDFNRDTGWKKVGEHGFEGVRIVAIDQDWSALRFRRVQYIKKVTRRKSMAMTEDAKKRTTGK